MADTYTATLRLQQPTIGSDAATWGGYLNTDLVLIDNAINGLTTINLNGLSAYTLTVANGAVDQARNLTYNFTGTLSGDCTVTLPPNVKFGWAINNTTGGFNVIMTTGGGSSMSVGNTGFYKFFVCDGTNVASPTVTFGGLNTTNSAVGGTLTVTGTTTLGAVTAGAATVSSLNSTGVVTIGAATHFTNGDGFIPYLGVNLSGALNQNVRNDASPVFADVGLTGLGFLKASFINQPVLTTSSPTFANLTATGAIAAGSASLGDIFLGYYGNNISAAINQDVRSSANVVFQTVRANSSGVAFSAPAGGGQALSGWTTTSDAALKENVATLTGALDRVCAMRGVSYTHKTLGGEHIGVIAQEMQKLRPEVVQRGDDGFLSVNYGALVAELIEAVKELRATMAELL